MRSRSSKRRSLVTISCVYLIGSFISYPLEAQQPKRLSASKPSFEADKKAISTIGGELAAVEERERENRKKKDPTWFAVEDAISKVLIATAADNDQTLGLDYAFAKAVLDAVYDNYGVEKDVFKKAKSDVLSLLNKNSSVSGMPVQTKLKWRAVSAKLKRLFAAERFYLENKKRFDAGAERFDFVSASLRRLREVETEFVVAAFSVFPVSREGQTSRKIAGALELVKLHQLHATRANSLRLWKTMHNRVRAGVATPAEAAAAHDMVYYYEVRWHEAKESYEKAVKSKD